MGRHVGRPSLAQRVHPVLICRLDARKRRWRPLEVCEPGFGQKQAAGKSARLITGRGSTGRLKRIAAIGYRDAQDRAAGRKASYYP